MRKIITGILALVICGAWVELVEAADSAALDQSNLILSSSAPSPGAQGAPASAPSGQAEPWRLLQNGRHHTAYGTGSQCATRPTA